MAINFRCPCGKVLSVGEENAGRKGACPGCGAILVIPASSPSLEEVRAAAPAADPAAAAAPAPAPPSIFEPDAEEEAFDVNAALAEEEAMAGAEEESFDVDSALAEEQAEVEEEPAPEPEPEPEVEEEPEEEAPKKGRRGARDRGARSGRGRDKADKGAKRDKGSRAGRGRDKGSRAGRRGRKGESGDDMEAAPKGGMGKKIVILLVVLALAYGGVVAAAHFTKHPMLLKAAPFLPQEASADGDATDDTTTPDATGGGEATPAEGGEAGGGEATPAEGGEAGGGEATTPAATEEPVDDTVEELGEPEAPNFGDDKKKDDKKDDIDDSLLLD